jgi:hypothetical protein
MHKWVYSLSLTALVLIISACSPQNENRALTATQPGTYAIDPLFREFYDNLGGAEYLGPAISPLYHQGNFKLQFTVSGLMLRDLSAQQASQRYQLAPLGLHLGVEEAPRPLQEDPDGRLVGGYVVYQGFLDVYDSLGGARYVGRPLTELRYNPEKERLEQYFENLGFYHLDSDPPGTVHTLAYGAFFCDYACRFRPFQASLPTRQGVIPEPFARDVSRLGPSFVGRAISDPYIAPDGMQEIIFDNLVLFVDPANPQRVFARPLLEKLGFVPHPLTTSLDDPRMLFHPIQGESGHNIPVVFSDYLALHGGLDISGPPITEISLHKERIWRQCFTNLCLDYHQDAPLKLRVRPAPLGIVYKAEYYSEFAVENFTASQSLQTITLKVAEERPIINSQETQRIHVHVFENNQPLPSFEPQLTITMPDGSHRDFRLTPTDATGHTALLLQPISAPNGTMIPYQVCLINIKSEQACIQETYMIWGNP